MTALIIGFGNPDCGDDGAGPMVARLLTGRVAARVLERHGDALALLDEWDGAESLLLIDAAAPMGTPGRVHRFDLALAELPRALAGCSTHAFGLAETIALSRRLGTLPARSVVYAIEGTHFAAGTAVSPCVAEAAVRLAGLLSANPL